MFATIMTCASLGSMIGHSIAVAKGASAATAAIYAAKGTLMGGTLGTLHCAQQYRQYQ